LPPGWPIAATPPRLAGEIAKALPFVLRAVDDSQIKAFLGRALGAQLRNAAVGPLAAQLVRALTAAGYHEAVLDRLLDYARAFLARNEDRLLETVAERKRSWIPRAINREIARAMLLGAAGLIDDLRQPDGAARRSLLAAIDEMTAELANASEQSQRKQPGDGVEATGAAGRGLPRLGTRVRDLALADLAAPSSRLRRALGAGDCLDRRNPQYRRGDACAAGCDVRRGAAEALPWRGELIRFVAEVVRKWEPKGFSDRIEMAVGSDLQYIRMNGTIVGGLVGGGLFLLSLLAR